MTVVTRFAPSPTGFLHIGSARTALFNYLFAKHHGGKFLLRIEDTDRQRSTQDAVDAIFNSLTWLGLDWDEEAVMQFSRAARHAEIAHHLVSEGKAYYCYCTPEELETMRETARQKGLSPRYDGRWRDRPAREIPREILESVRPVIRFKAPQTGETVIDDLVQGSVTLQNDQLDDMVLLRADGTPTYMLSVVVDDHDMGITHIIRGDDHLTNAFRQFHLYSACEWSVPHFAHIPLIHGPDGAKLSKRHGALGAETYKEMGFLPEALCNYLVRLGWSHGDDEVISRQQAIAWFDGGQIGRSPSRFDVAKLTNLNAHYIREADNTQLLTLIIPLMEIYFNRPLSSQEKDTLLKGMNGLKSRAKTVLELAENARFYIAVSWNNLSSKDPKAAAFTTPPSVKLVQAVHDYLNHFHEKSHTAACNDPWNEEKIEISIRHVAQQTEQKLGALAQPLRVALTGSTVSPSVFEVMMALGKNVSLRRLQDFIKFHEVPSNPL